MTTTRGTTVAERRVQAGEGSPRRSVLHPWAGHLRHDIDEVVVQRLMDGARVEHYTAWERRAAVCRLRRAGAYWTDICQRVGIDMRQVGRDLQYAEEVA